MMRDTVMKITSLTLIWILLSSILVEAAEQDNALSRRQQNNRDDIRRLTYTSGNELVKTIYSGTGNEGKVTHKNQDHRDEDEEDFIVPGIAFTHISPTKSWWDTSFLNKWEDVYFRICCRSNYI